MPFLPRSISAHLKKWLSRANPAPIIDPIKRAIQGFGPFDVLRRTKAVKNATDEDLAALTGRAGDWAERSVWAVVIALAAEAFVGFLPSSLIGLGEFFCNGIVAVGVCLELLFSKGGSNAQGELTRRSNERLAEAKEEASSAFAEAILAGATADVALGDLFRAKVRIAELEKEAADARLETEKLRARTAWRTVSGEALSKMRDAVLASGPAACLGIFFWGSDPESRYFAKLLSIPFALSKWDVQFIAASYADDTMFEVVIPLDEKWNDENIGIMKRVAEAFDAGEIAYSRGTLPKWSMSTSRGDSLTSPWTYIYVGPKLPPLFDGESANEINAASAAADSKKSE